MRGREIVPVKSNRCNNTGNSVDSSILICEGYFTVKNLAYEREEIQAYHLGYRIGCPKTMPDGVTAMAVIMDWREFEISSSVKRPKMMRWFTQYQSTVAQLQWQQHASWSQHRAFA